MLIVVVKLTSLILLTIAGRSSGCPGNWFDCGNDRCIAMFWKCDGDNDCGNLKDEENCGNVTSEVQCLSSQFECEFDKHCIPERWHCDGDKDCDDGSDEANCGNVTKCTGFTCRDHHCIPLKWHCDGHKDCPDGSDEEFCSPGKLCRENEFVCSSGSCINESLVCDKHEDCTDGSDEGSHCGDSCDNATCSQNCRNTPAGPQCYCNDGYSLAKDNKTCSDINECLEEGFCSHQCENTPGSYKCSCNRGYELVNRTCRARGADPLLVFTTLQEIRAMHLGSERYYLIRRAVARASAVDVDPKTEHIYWAEISNRSSIYSAKTDGSGFKNVLSHGLLVPEDIAVDYVANNLYLTDSGLKQVLACKTDGTMCTVLHKENIGKPRSIALDPAEGFMYWSDWGEGTAGIYRSGMDGSRRIPFVSSKIGWPNGIAIDHSTNRLYWADAKLNKIEYITLDGTVRKVILNETVFHPYSLAVFEDTLYWTDWSTFSLESCNKFTGHRMTLIARENGKHIMGVHVYHPVLTARVNNPCWSSECSHMCLLSPESGFTCACPHGFELGSDRKTCRMSEKSGSVFVSEGSSIFYVRPPAVGSEAITELPLPVSSVISKVDFDANLKYLFVAYFDLPLPAIYAVNMSSLSMRALVRNNLTTPVDLAFDWRSNNLYWVDYGKGTIEIVSVDSLKRAEILRNLNRPVAIAISPAKGIMFVSTIGSSPAVSMYNMDGRHKRLLHTVNGRPMSLSLHPSKSMLFWADPSSGTISYMDFVSSRSPRILKAKLGDISSIAVSEEYVYWTNGRRELNMIKGNVTHSLQLPGEERRNAIRRVTYSPGTASAAKSECMIGNGGCSYLCITSPSGKTCACEPDMKLADDNVTCLAKQCEATDFKCMNGRCLPSSARCDGSRDCEDGSDEVGCGSRCSGDDFQCKNGRCILKSWRCDKRNDCADNSDEEDCPEAAACTKDQISCKNGECVPVLWRCDGEKDCLDGTDEEHCNVTRCDSAGHYRCDSGQCIPVSWVCDGSKDCYDDSDEKNCSKPNSCTSHEFRCNSDGSCIDEMLKCDGRKDCSDGSDERNCSESHPSCKDGMYRCKDGACIYDYEVCDGHNDCSNNEEEQNCTHSSCQPEEMLCPSSKRCILQRWICDGDPDCTDESDEENCDSQEKPQTPKSTTLHIDETCDGFYCYVTSECLPWIKVCDGRLDCQDIADEGGLCHNACSGNNGGCSHVCKETPFGPRCLCHKGYRLLPDNRTCDDINECGIAGTCSHYCNNTRGGFKCSCAEGYVLHNDHRFCKAVGGPASLVYLLGDKIKIFDLHSHDQHVTVDVKSADMKGMDYDASRQVFIWTERNDGSVNTFSPETRKKEVIIRSFLRPTYIRYDWIADNLYLRDESSSIVACTRDAKFCKTIVKASETRIDSLDISPIKGFMFWTIWANTLRKLYSGLIMRAEMDGTHRTVLLSDKMNAPTALTVDHVLERIYWSDGQLNTISTADFHGHDRKEIIKKGVYHPFAIALFEDDIYWADWGSDSIMRCNKFTTSEDCEKVTGENVKAHILIIIHKAMRPKGVNRCLASNCTGLCLLTRFSSVCACEGDNCESDSTPPPPLSSVECPVGYCHEGECTVENGRYICKCSPPYSGETCEVKAAASAGTPNSEYSYSWVAAVFMAVVVTGIIIIAIFMYIRNREKFHRMGESVSVKFRNPKPSREGRLVMDTDDNNVYDELVIDQNGDYRGPHGNSDYASSETDESDLKKWQSFGLGSYAAFNKNITGFFRKLRSNNSQLL